MKYKNDELYEGISNTDDPEILHIDTNILDREWSYQPRLFFRYAKMLADARQDYEAAKSNLKVVAAELDRGIRRKALKREEKLTTQDVTARVQESEEYIAADRTVIAAKHRLDILDAAVTALEHRKQALENLVRLHGQNYFSVPKTDGDDAKNFIENTRKRNTRKRSQ